GGVLALVFLSAVHLIVNSSVWTMLQAGRQTAARGWPLLTDVFSFSVPGKAWVTIPWLFEWLNALIYDLIVGQAHQAANAAGGGQIAAGVLIGLNATLGTLTALVLLRIRRPGPGLWWSAVCVGLALGGIIHPDLTNRAMPFQLSLGGIAGVAE